MPGDSTIETRFKAAGRFTFIRSTWQDLPTLYHIVNTLADIELAQAEAASLTLARGAADHADQRIIRDDTHRPA